MSNMNGTVDLETFKTKNFWRTRVPHLHISDKFSNVLSEQVDQKELLLNKGNLIEEGYQQFDNAIDAQSVTILRDGISTLQQQGLLPVFCMLFDEYWLCLASLKNLIEDVLGEKAQMLPDFWAWYLDPSLAQAGWPPHRDKNNDTLLESGMPKSLTMWLALTDATPINGCMYMVPANLDPYYKNFDNKEAPTDPQTFRALTASAGSLLIWNQRVYHWGGRSSKRAETPRISIAFEFQRGDTAPYNNPLLPLQLFPNFETRLKLVGKQILQYRHIYGFSAELSNLAESFLK